MTLPTVARRGLAVVASAALLSSGAAGVFTGTAWAANNGVPTSTNPTSTNNSGDSALTVNGLNFNPSTDNALLTPEFQSAYSSSSTGTPGLNAVTNASQSSSTSLVGTLPSSNAAPGVYDVYTFRSGGPAGGLSTKCAGTQANPCTFTISSSGAPNLSSVVAGASTGNTGRGANALDLSGQNLAQASYVKFLQADGSSPEPGITFTVGDPNDSSTFSGYASSSLIRGNYTLGSSFTPGKHFIQVTNTVGEKGAAVEFWQPTFTANGVSPNTTGAGTSNKTITVTGQGIRANSHLVVASEDLDPVTPGKQADLSVGAATVSPDGTSISAPITVDPSANADTRSVTIVGPDGGNYTVPNAFTITSPPSLGSLDTEALGQGASYTETISGSNFAAGNTPATMPVFTVSGAGVTTKTLSSTNISAKVLFTVASDAPTGDRSVTVTNPDGGSTTVDPSQTGAPFTVDAGPTISSVSPPSAAAGTSKTVTISGFNFAQNAPLGRGVTVQFSLPPMNGAARTADPSMSVGTVTVTKGQNGTADTAKFTLSVSGNAPAGLRDVVLTNNNDFGSALCAGCFGVDNLTASPTTGSNNGTKQISLTGPQVVAGSTAKLVRAGDPTIQPAIPGTSTTVSGTTLTGIFDLTDAAPGPYNAVVTTPGGAVLSCTQCFTVTGSTPSITSVTPASGGQGAKNLPITISGNNFSRGEQVTITNLLVHDVQWVNRTTLTAQVDIPSNAAAQADDLKVTNADGAASATKTGAFTVTKPPSPTAVSPTSYGQGAQGVKVTVTGPDFVQGATVDLGPGITVVGTPTVTQGQVIPVVAPDPDDTLVATVNIDENAAAIQRDVTVTNPDGGTGTLAKGFAVNFGPKVTGITPVFLAPDGSGSVTIAGSNFSTTSGKTATPKIQGVTLSNVVVASDGNSLTADAKVDSGTPKGALDVVVTNPTDSGTGTCKGCFYVATPPSAPVQVHTVSVTGTSATVGWSAPSDNGGAPVTSYVVSATGPDGKPAGTPSTLGASATSGTVTALTAGVKYTISVIARNVAGDSPAGTTLTQTTGTSSTKPTLTINKSAMNVGQSATLIIRGTPGDSVGFYQRVQPASTFSLFKTFTFDSLGNVTVTSFPRTNTAYFARTAAGDSGIVTLSVRPAVSLRGSSSHRLATFTGVIVPGHGGVKVRIYTVKNGVLGPLVASAITDAQGHYTATHQFAGTGRVTFIAQTISDKIALAGQSNRLSLLIQ